MNSRSVRKGLALGLLSTVVSVAVAQSAGLPVTVECLLKIKYRVHTDRPVTDAVNQYTCQAKVIASSDVDATDIARRQVVFSFGRCPRLPDRVVFSGTDVTEVRELRRGMIKAHLFAGECSGCVISPNADVTGSQLDSGHFDATFLVRAVDPKALSGGIILPAGKGYLTLRSERTDDLIVKGRWIARKCEVVPQPPIFCGGIAGIPCPSGMICVDWPNDQCDPNAGGADCIGMCVPGS